jgi:hypothetical protein
VSTSVGSKSSAIHSLVSASTEPGSVGGWPWLAVYEKYPRSRTSNSIAMSISFDLRPSMPPLLRTIASLRNAQRGTRGRTDQRTMPNRFSTWVTKRAVTSVTR